MADKIERPRSQRQLQVGETLRQALSEIFMREDFYGPNGETIYITISEVRISPDLHNATVFFMPLGGKDKEKTEKLLRDISPKIRSFVSKKVQLRFVPELFFKLDETFDNAQKVSEIIESTKTPND